MTDDEFRLFLDDISVCFIAQDLALWRSRVDLPFTIVTKDGPTTITTDAALKDNFNLYLKASEIMGLDLIARTPISLEDGRDGSFIGTYRTELLCDQQRMADPYISSALLRHSGGNWRMSSILNARGHHEWTGVHPMLKGDTDV